MLNMMESVVALGTGKRAQVKGYRVGGKTGTSEDGVNTNKYIASFLGVAPISDPTVIVLVTLYDPKRRRRSPRRCGCSACWRASVIRGFTIFRAK